MLALQKIRAERGVGLAQAHDPGAPAAHELLIKVAAAGICGTDLHIYNWDKWAQSTIPVPMIVGHEYVGTGEKLGAEVVERFHNVVCDERDSRAQLGELTVPGGAQGEVELKARSLRQVRCQLRAAVRAQGDKDVTFLAGLSAQPPVCAAAY